MMEEPKEKKKRATKEEKEEIQTHVLRLLAGGNYPSDIKRVIASKYEMSPRSVEGYISRARADLLEQIGIRTEEHRANAYGFYRSMMKNKKLAPKDRLKAQERIDRLLGLESAQKHEVTGKDGAELYPTRDQNVLNDSKVMDLVCLIEERMTEIEDTIPDTSHDSGRTGPSSNGSEVAKS